MTYLVFKQDLVVNVQVHHAQHLLGIDHEVAKIYENVLINDDIFSHNYHQIVKFDYTSTEILRPEFNRFILTYFMDEDRVDFILNSIRFVANIGWKFLPLFNFNLETGEWKQKNYTVRQSAFIITLLII